MKDGKDILDEIDLGALHEEDTNTPTQKEPELDPIEDEVFKKDDKAPVEVEEEEVEEQEEEIVEEDSETESSLGFLVQDFQTQTGLEFTDEELDQIAALDDNSLESVSKMAVITGKKLAEAEREAFYEQNPDLYQAMLYKQAKGSLQGFSQEMTFPDYTGLDLESEDNQKMIYTEYLKLKGSDAEEIADLIESAETKNTLKNKAEAAQQAVDKFYSKQKEDRTKALEAEIEENERGKAAFVKQTFDVIDSGKVMGVTLDKKEQQSLKEFSGKIIDKEGRTAKEIAYGNLTIEQMLLIDLFVKNGFKSLAVIEKPTADKLKAAKEKLQKRIPPPGDSKKAIAMGSGIGEIDMDAVNEFTSSSRRQ